MQKWHISFYHITPAQKYRYGESLKQFNFGANTVLRLMKNLEKNRHLIYFDNFFYNVSTFTKITEKKIYAAETIRTNRVLNPPYLTDKGMKKLGRTYFYYLDNSN